MKILVRNQNHFSYLILYRLVRLKYWLGNPSISYNFKLLVISENYARHNVASDHKFYISPQLCCMVFIYIFNSNDFAKNNET